MGCGEKMMVRDPVCGMEVDETESIYQYEYKGETYHFCSEHCMEDFIAEPEKCLAEDEY
jgi:Cu+-exporting ATPase